jgi:hypothetical protein
MQYFLSMPLSQHHNLKNPNRITRTGHGLTVNARYDPEPGLRSGEPAHSDAGV